ncbi:MAG: hypothetical protein MMC33_004829 [Icmadophila ericetorum]|nr:hypothetical protein [Icmadophila ericetorum]
MASGPCTATVHVCTCRQRSFHISTIKPKRADEISYNDCTHLASQHDSYSSFPSIASNSTTPRPQFAELRNDALCPRSQTTSHLSARVQDVRVVYVRGTPASGSDRGITPMSFSPDQRVSLQPLDIRQSSAATPDLALFFNSNEYKDVLLRAQNPTGINNTLLILSDSLAEAVWDITCGHPGAVSAIVQVLSDCDEVRRYRKEATEVPLEIGLTAR